MRTASGHCHGGIEALLLRHRIKAPEPHHHPAATVAGQWLQAANRRVWLSLPAAARAMGGTGDGAHHAMYPQAGVRVRVHPATPISCCSAT